MCKAHEQLRIVVEGFDGSGKSTLVANLAEHFGKLGLRCQTIGRNRATATPAIAAITERILAWDAGLELVDSDTNARSRLARAQARVELAEASTADVILFDRWLPSDLSRLEVEPRERYLSDFVALHRGASMGLTVRLDAPYETHWERIAARPLEEWSPSELLGPRHVASMFERYADVWNRTWSEPRLTVDAAQSPDRVLQAVVRAMTSSRGSPQAS